ncbi:beta-galactosidase [Isoptericola sp. CG 20/1183]|uniref:Beta-galactosidase n=1 Tax=Isoptericola halotolerans TaxID=300560 RepID=A0ABX5EHS9_9MICO|nr:MULTISPECIES: beta-galactosidase [Isoptericola]MCK0116700.1 beta-galactosidase [Isoptericola sp. S6320L]PRZ04188.1 beta-galactosidase [Isoptericola sp. CG 20/1183]PRZ09987.1 beta-galactosidase [Isoptericola halotolerans]
MTDVPRLLAGPETTRPARLGYGADYNPDQWPREVWAEDARLMQAAGVTVVSVAIFSWARIQPAPDRWDFGWLDEVMDLMHAHGISVDLATATASPPPWLTTAHPEILPVTRTGETLWPGGRQQWRPTSPVFREHALALVEKMAERYAAHPALAAWHVSNELGCHNVEDYSDDAARAFRTWLTARYGTLDRLNEAWGTAFWSQRYTDWEQILPPRLAASYPNPTQQLDFKRFSSDALVEHLRAERDVLRRITPDVPVTTNFMVMGETKGMDYAAWAPEIDFVSNDHYLQPGPQGREEMSFSANLTSGVAGGRPWFLMEHSTSAVNWQPVNVPKRPGELARDSLTHVAHGADAVCFFQWRQSAAGAEKYHSAMVPHAGEDSALFRDVVALGRTLADLAPVVGAERAPARAAILFDWDSWWASELDSHPTEALRYRAEALDWYHAFLDAGVRADVVPVAGLDDGRTDLADYDVVVAPVLHVVPAALADRLTRWVEAGGHLVTTYFSGIVDADDHVWLGGYPGALRDLLGLRIEELNPLRDGERVRLDDGSTGTLWTDRIDVLPGTDVLATYLDGQQAGRPAVTRRAVERGSAAYVSTRLGAAGLRPLLERLLDAAGVRSELPEPLRGRVELTVRRTADEEFWFLVNRTDEALGLAGLDGKALVSTTPHDGEVADARPSGEVPADTLAPRGVVVLRRPRA